jgi:hypothetical protein
MTSDSVKEGRAEVKRYFALKIAFAEERIKHYKLQLETADSRGDSTAMRAFYTSAIISGSQYFETMDLLDGLTAIVYDLNDGIRKLDKTVQNIAEKTGVDISNVKADVDELKETVGPKINAVIQLLANLQKEEERRKKNGEPMLV